MSRFARQCNRCVRWCGRSLAAVAFGAALGTPGVMAQDAAEGKRLFETICIACHTIGAGVRIGPDLQAVAERRTVEWLRTFIRNPDQLRQAGDSVAATNLAKYAIPMPALGLSPQQVESVIAHLGAAQPAPAGRPALYLPTLALAVVAAAGITLVALTFGTKRVEIRA